MLGATARPKGQRSASDEAQSVGSAAPQLTAAEVLEASGVETDRFVSQWSKRCGAAAKSELMHSSGRPSHILAFHSNLLQSRYCQLSPSPKRLHSLVLDPKDPLKDSSALICRTH